VAEAAGDYRLVVQPKDLGTDAGSYQIRIEELRGATENDRTLHDARRLYEEYLNLRSEGKYDEAIPLVERALETRERLLGLDHRDVADAVDGLAGLYHEKGEYTKAEPLYGRALAIREKVLGPEHPNVAQSLSNLGSLYRDKGEYEKAASAHQRALAIREKALGPEHSLVASSFNGLAVLYYYKGEYANAEPFYERALAIIEKTQGPEHPDLAVTLNNFAELYRMRGDDVKVEPLYRRALAIRKKALGPEHPDVALVLNNLARLYRDRGDYEKAEPLFHRALAIWKKALGPEHPNVALVLNNLAVLYHNRLEYAKAESLYQQALAIQKKALGPQHPLVASSLNGLAILYYRKGEDTKAEPLYQRALAIWEESLGPQHPNVARSLDSLAKLYAAKGEIPQAMLFQSRANAISERNLALNLSTGSERQKLAYLALSSKQTAFTLQLHSQAAPNDPQALILAFTTLLRRKGRGLDAMTDTIATLRRRATPQGQELFDRLAEARSQLAAFILKEPGSAKTGTYRTQLKLLEEKVEDLEVKLSVRSAEFRTQSQPVTLSAVKAALPSGSALIEFVVYTPRDLRTDKDQPPRYLAYLLAAQAEPRWVDLGEAAPIDRAVDDWRRSLRGNLVDVKRLGRVVDEKVMRPVRSILSQMPGESGEPFRLLIAPDGSLSLIPFAALVDERDRYLIEKYTISYLTSGRDLLRLQPSAPSRSAPLVVANPLFGGVESIATRGTRKSGNSWKDDHGRKQSDPSRRFFRPLPGTQEEALAIKAVLPEASVLMQGQATEAALKEARAPRILHIATHGFFLSDQGAPPAEIQGEIGEDLLRLSDLRLGKWAAHIEDPLLRSGLALAGANQDKEGDDDGVLTALEVAGLDLWGTKLVVLSACDTGVGEVKNGEGVQGLRRALVLAGSESQVMSLWAVPDQWGQAMMKPYYEALRRGAGRSDGLRQVQLRMLCREDRQHPFYWAALIQSGAWESLDGYDNEPPVGRLLNLIRFNQRW
jgi:CHAT domain-containing protein/tetratricopeptide (TPR) repeat protein